MSINCTHPECKFMYECSLDEDEWDELVLPEPTAEEMEEYEERKRARLQRQQEY